MNSAQLVRLTNPVAPSPPPGGTDSSVPAARLTVVESIYYQAHDGEPITAGEPFGFWLQTDEQPCSRRQWIEPSWSLLDLGWMVKHPISQLHVTHLADPPGQTQPTPQDQDRKARRVIELGILDRHYLYHPDQPIPDGAVTPTWILLPGESMRGRPAPGMRLVARAPHGRGRLVVTAYPA